MTPETATFRPRLRTRRGVGRFFAVLCLGLTLVGIIVLAIFLIRVASEGWPWVSTEFLPHFPSTISPEKAGIKSALAGTLWLAAFTALFSLPIGVGAAIYLQEYAGEGRFTRFIQINIANLAGVPSIVYGILGLAVFIRGFQLGRSVLAGALTMSLLVLPVIIIASREALAAYGLGATRWQVVRHHVLPAALPGIMTGVILALSRAIGEAAPLIVIGALTYVAFVPTGPLDAFTAMSIQIYDWTSRPQQDFHLLAAAGIIVLLVVLLSMNAVAVGIRMWQQRNQAQ